MDVELWLGSQSSYDEYQTALKNVSAAMLGGREPPAEASLAQQHGDVAIVQVRGTLTNNDSPFNAMFGMTSYTEIRNSVIEAAMADPPPGAMVLDISSHGGTPNGLSDVAELVQAISASGIPVYTYSSGPLSSAAYWLGSAADKVFISPAAEAGSIGVIATVFDRTKMMADMGIKPEVFRYGDHKAPGNGMEPLTKEARAEIQAHIDAIGGEFESTVARYRGVSVADVKSRMGGGRVFVGKDAVRVGLADGVTTLDALVGKLQGEIALRKGKESPMASKKLLSAQQAALVASGVPTDPPADPVAEPTTEAASPADPPAASPVDTKAEGTPPAEPPEAPKEPELVSFLRSELTAKQAEVLDLSTKLSLLKQDHERAVSLQEPMRKIVEAAASRLQIGLGGAPLDLSQFTGEALVQFYSGLDAKFTKLYPVGSQVAPPTDVDDDATKKSAQSGDKAKLRAVKF